MLVAHSRASLERAQAALAEVQTRVEKLFGSGPRDGSAPIPAGANGQLDSLAQWLDTLRSPVTTEEISGLTRDQLEARLIGAIEDRYRPEMRRMERMLLLQIVDSTWKDHLLVMQKLRDSVGLQGYAQIDPKVEYKREGMKLFEEMWKHVGDRSTQFVFKIEQLNEEFVGSTWVETSATHAEAPDMREEFQQGGQGRQGAAGTTNSGQEDAQSRTDSQSRAACRTQRSLPLRERQRIQETVTCGRGASSLVAAGRFSGRHNPRQSRGIGPMAQLLNIAYLLVLLAASPWLVWQAIFSGKYREGWRAKFWGQYPSVRATAVVYGCMRSVWAK